MKAKRRKPPNQLERQEMIAFEFKEALEDIVRDLSHIDAMCPAEIARHGCLVKDTEAAAIIEARKADFLSYIQTIARDHVHWGRKLLERGWLAKHRKEASGRK